MLFFVESGRVTCILCCYAFVFVACYVITGAHHPRTLERTRTEQYNTVTVLSPMLSRLPCYAPALNDKQKPCTFWPPRDELNRCSFACRLRVRRLQNTFVRKGRFVS